MEPEPRHYQETNARAQIPGDVAGDVLDLDRQHGRIFQLIDEFNRAIRAADERRRSLILFDKVLRHTREHFVYEDSLFARIDFPRYEIHRLKHAQIVRGIEQTRDDWMIAPRAFSTTRIEHALDSLLVHLIQDEVGSIARLLAGAKWPE